MKLIGCSNCFKPIPSKQASFVDGKRVCNECKSKRYDYLSKRKKEHIKALVEGTIASDPIRQEETISLFVEVLEEYQKRDHAPSRLF